MGDVQRLIDLHGGFLERVELVAVIRHEADNILGAYGASGRHVASVGWRPFDPNNKATNGLFLT